MRRTIEVMRVVAIVLDLVYWTLWFTQRDWIASEHRQAYNDFENVFPLRIPGSAWRACARS
jgi:hypothetical protein